MLNNVTVRITPYYKAPSLKQLGLWLNGAELFPRSMFIAEAVDEAGEVICDVCYIALADTFFITAFSVNPRATVEEAKKCGNLIDASLEKRAQAAGVSRLLIFHPNTNECEEVRTYQLLMSPSFDGVGYKSVATQYLN